VDGFPIRVPMLDIHTVGAGGGSIARVDEGGLLRVGPESAGAVPGPACYGQGDQATVTDAHVVLGRIAARQFLGGEMTIDVERSEAAVDRIAKALRLSRTATAEGILRVANANMQRAIGVVSVERGHDPREFALVAFGGCGGLHACEVAGELGIGTVIVPQLAGALSALGMICADRIRDYTASVLNRRDPDERLGELERRALGEMPGARLERFADIRYAGQSYELTVRWNPRNPGTPFHREHERQYGYASPERAIEIVNLRVRARETVSKPRLRRPTPVPAVPEKRRVRISGRWARIPVWRREELPSGRLPGPALVLDYGSTTMVPAGWKFQLDAAGNLLVSR
jgi:N-methylhydantoinase A